MLGKYLVVALFIAILLSLGSALYAMLNSKKGGPEKTARALTLRIGLSLGLFLLLLGLFASGFIQPHGVIP